jgi:Fur family iron response transcriptional regulator
MATLPELLRERGIQPSAQRVAVAASVLDAGEHLSADQVLGRVRESFPQISRATVYNTLNLFVEKGLLRQLALTGGHTVFDPNTARHHHLVDEVTGRIYDVDWEAIHVADAEHVPGFHVRDYQVVLRGRRAD